MSSGKLYIWKSTLHNQYASAQFDKYEKHQLLTIINSALFME